MIIERLDLKAFGKFTDVSIDLSAGPRRFHIVYGANESGKSTSLRAITSLLFGMEHRTSDNYVHSNAQMRVGGVLSNAETAITCVRRRGRKATLRGADDNEVVDEAVLSQMLGGINRETFLSRFGLSHQELVSGGAAMLAGQGDLGEILFAAGAGVSELRKMLAELKVDCDALFVPRGARVINSALKELEAKRKELREAQTQPTEFMDLSNRIAEKQKQIDDLESQANRATIELAKWRAIQQALPLLPQQKKHITALAAVRDVRPMDDDFRLRRRDSEIQLNQAAKQQQEINARIIELENQLESFPCDAEVSNQKSEIESLFQERGAREKADRDQVDLFRVQRNLDRKLTDILRDLSISVDRDGDLNEIVSDAVDRLRVGDALRARLTELAGKYERLAQQRDDADNQLKTLKRKLADVNSELNDVGQVVDATTLSAVLDEVGSPIVLLNSLSEQQDVCTRLEQQCQTSLSRLDGFQGDIQQAVDLRLPASSSIDEATRRIEQAVKSVDEVKNRLATLSSQRDSLKRQLAAENSSSSLPTLKELAAARTKRDELLDGLADAELTKEAISDLRQQVKDADKISDIIREHHQEVHRRELEQQRMESFDHDIVALESEHEIAMQQLQSAQDAWSSIWDDCGIEASAPGKMIQWVAQHEKLKNSFEQLSAEKTRLHQIDSRVVRATSRIQSALNSVAAPTIRRDDGFTQAGLFEEAPAADLHTLYGEAMALRTNSQNKRERFTALRRKREELSDEIPAAETKHEARDRDFQQWTEDWQRITEPFAETGDTTPSVVVANLRKIDELCEKKRERDIVASRIQSITNDAESYCDRVKTVAAALQVKPATDADWDAGVAIRTLYSRLQAERSAEGKRALVVRELASAKEQSAGMAKKQESSAIVLEQLCKEAGVANTDELPDYEQRARQQEQLMASLREVENQLSLLAVDGDIEDFIQQASEQEPALVDDRIQQQQLAVSQLKEQLAAAQREIGSLQHEMDAISGGSKAADINQSIQMLTGKIEAETQQYARLKVATLIMRRAIEHYREQNQSPVLAVAEQMFAKLTCGEYKALKVDYDAKGKSILFGVRASGSGELPAEVPVPSMSVGTADSLYLALRLASLQHQLKFGSAVPVVIDDCLVQLDDQRAIAAIKVLSQLSESTQVILFTHHRHLLDLAKQNLLANEFHVQNLQ